MKFGFPMKVDARLGCWKLTFLGWTGIVLEGKKMKTWGATVFILLSAATVKVRECVDGGWSYGMIGVILGRGNGSRAVK